MVPPNISVPQRSQYAKPLRFEIVSKLPKIQELSRTNYPLEARVVAVHLRVRTISPPMTIANQSAKYHGSIQRMKACPVDTHTKAAAPVIAERTRPSIMVATISLPLAAIATTHPTNIDAITCPIAIPSVAKNT